MIELYLIVFIVALIIANILVAIARPKRRSSNESDSYSEGNNSYEVQSDLVNALQSIDQKHSITQGAISATQQKLNILNDRLTSVEQAVSGIIENKMNAPQLEAAAKTPSAADEYDYDKLEFRLKVLENGLEELRKPRVFPKTFYGKVDPDMEKEVRSLVFNTKKKTTE